MDYTREQLERMIAAKIAEEDIERARQAHQAATTDRVLMSDIRPGMTLAEKKRIADHILRLQAQQ
jgi:hypothetical protein